MVGIVSYGTYIPKYRIKIAEIASVWKKDFGDIEKSLGIIEKSVPNVDEDAVTLALEAGNEALSYSSKSLINIGAIMVGSESHPYAVNPTATIVGELLGIGNCYIASDMQFACKAGTTAMISILGLVEAKQIEYGLAIGTDCAQSKPHDVLEYTSGSGSCAYLLGRENLIAKLISTISYASDTPDFWRRDGIKYPTHAGRFTGEPAYFTHIINAANLLFKKTKLKPSDFDYCVFHMPNGKFPKIAAYKLGFCEKQILPSMIVSQIGNPYSASSMLGLASVLEICQPKQKIFMVSYGSGAGSDAFVWETTEKITAFQKLIKKTKNDLKNKISQKIYINYPEYLKQTGKI